MPRGVLPLLVVQVSFLLSSKAATAMAFSVPKNIVVVGGGIQGTSVRQKMQRPYVVVWLMGLYSLQ